MLQIMDCFSGKVLLKFSLKPAYKLDVKIWLEYDPKLWSAATRKQWKINWERPNYLPLNTHLEGKLSSKYYLKFTG